MGPSRQELLTALGAFALLLLLCGGSAWYYVGRGQAEEAAPVETQIAKLEPAQLTQTAVGSLPTATVTSTRTPLPPPSPIPSPSPVPSLVLPSVSPVATPRLLGRVTSRTLVIATPAATATVTATATLTPPPHDYVVIGHEVQDSPLYSYVSGWIVETDGVTPRPVRVRLRFPSGEMTYPRPNNRDVADGHYEFMASPGHYWLEVVGDGSSPAVPVIIGDQPARHEISFKLATDRPAISPARSSPWDDPDPQRPVGAASKPAPEPVTTIDINYHIFIPSVGRPGTTIYFPFVGGAN